MDFDIRICQKIVRKGSDILTLAAIIGHILPLWQFFQKYYNTTVYFIPEIY